MMRVFEPLAVGALGAEVQVATGTRMALEGLK
jgi:hypothetical protein